MRLAADSQMDAIAEDLGIDPVEIRLRNARETGDVMPNKGWISSCELPQCIKRTSENERWKERRGQMPQDEGMGIACWSYVSAARHLAHDSTAAIIKVFEDGTASLITGASDIGQGSNTTMAQIAAEELGVALEDITVVSGDTDITPFDFGTFASRVTYISGNAVKAAAKDAKQQIFNFVADKLEANVDDLISRDRRICVKGSPGKGMDFSQAVRGCLFSEEGLHIIGRGNYDPDTVVVNQITYEGHSTPAFGFGAQIANVSVNRKTGQVTVLRIGGAHDCGVAINPMHAEGQLEGATAQALGQALYEDLATENGQVMNPSFLEYKIPTALDMPEMNTELVEGPDPGGPFGAKGMSEGCILAPTPAIANAVYHAVGVRIKEFPITSERIMKALEEKAGKEE